MLNRREKPTFKFVFTSKTEQQAFKYLALLGIDQV